MNIEEWLNTPPGIFDFGLLVLALIGLGYGIRLLRSSKQLQAKITLAESYMAEGLDEDAAMRKAGITERD